MKEVGERGNYKKKRRYKKNEEALWERLKERKEKNLVTKKKYKKEV